MFKYVKFMKNLAKDEFENESKNLGKLTLSTMKIKWNMRIYQVTRIMSLCQLKRKDRSL